MASITIIYWRDIPAQVVAEEGRGRNRRQAKIELPQRFSVAIDAAAMRDGADSTDDYLAEWRKSTPVPCADDLDTAAAELAAQLEADYPQTRVAKLVEMGGREKNMSSADRQKESR